MDLVLSIILILVMIAILAQIPWQIWLITIFILAIVGSIKE
jgi:hypothetical protein